jgi:curved DNA-binding protein CbpA
VNTTLAMGVTAGITVGELGHRGLPTAVSGIDVRKLPIGPTEAFVLSRLDGHSDVHEIALTTGLSSEQVTIALQLLVKLGAVRWPAAPSAPPGSQKPLTEAVSERRQQADGEASPALSEAQRQRIQTLADGCALKDYYELLGIPRTAEKAQIKEAYFTLVAEIHPDRFFGKDLGDLKSKLEALFKRLTEAHDTLTRSRRRAEYDAGLPPQIHDAQSPPSNLTGRGLQATPAVHAPAVHAPAVHAPAVHAPAVHAPAVHAPAATPIIAPAASVRPATSDPVPSAPASLRVPPPANPGRSGQIPRIPNPPATPPSISRASLPPVSIRNTLRSPAERYVQAAAGAQREGNSLSALNSLRIAASILPNDEVLRTRVSDLEVDVDRQQADKLLADARQAEAKGDASHALRLYARVVKATQSPAHCRRAAEYALSAGQHQQAAEFARKGLSSNENDVQFRILLGRAYFEAEMHTSARREFERASELAPSDPNVKDWLKRIKRGDV